MSIGSEASISALSDALIQNSGSDRVHDKEETLLWIVDPIDGTSNFQSGTCRRKPNLALFLFALSQFPCNKTLAPNCIIKSGLPLFCVSIGVVSSKGEVVVGVIYNPILDEMTYAIRGQGCYVNGKKLGGKVGSKNTVIRLSEGLINVGFPAAKESTLMVSSRAVQALATKVKGLRMIASASQVMAWVAQKKLNAYVSWDLNSWDVCAGMLIVEEAGGYISDLQGNKIITVESRDLIVSCEGAMREGGANDECLHMELLKVLTKNDCINYDK